MNDEVEYPTRKIGVRTAAEVNKAAIRRRIGHSPLSCEMSGWGEISV